MDHIVRAKKVEDSEDIVYVVTKSWNETYRGIVNDKFLDDLYINQNVRLSKEIDSDVITYVLEVNNVVVGFIKVGAGMGKYENDGEIYSLYILEYYKGHGWGRELFNAGMNKLKEMGFKRVIVGCLEGNFSNTFYTHLGGKKIATRLFTKTGEELVENVYEWCL